MIKTHCEPGLYARELGRQAVSVKALLAWCEGAGHVLPATVPDILEFEAVALESLLCAVERGVRVKYRASEIEDDASSPRLKRRLIQDLIDAVNSLTGVDPRVLVMVNEGTHQTALWELGASAAAQWRQLVSAAVEAGGLATFDAETGISMGGTLQKETAARLSAAERLSKLTELGGTAAGSRGRRKFTKINELAAWLKSQGQDGHDPKTIRKQLSEHLDSQAGNAAIRGGN